MPDRDWWAVLWPDPEGMLRRIGVQPEMTVLDLCCGDGYFTAPLARLVGGRVYALDIDPLMIDQAKAEVARQGASVLKWICADAREVARLLPEPVDYVLMANTFHGVPDQPCLARAVRTLLRPQGVFCIVNWHAAAREETPVLGKPRGPGTDMRMSPDAVRTVVEPEGFRTARPVELPPYHYAAIFAQSSDES
ncbi:methyltransferase [Phyllobacterium zundukense]|uniref:Methyltransferase n=2 Tax=Phyllobacterium zundukense TaxID=1867719 RepID=A0A2N9VZP0_9HYPH|nr:methyltransferase [Phyllobacterium zundukense]